MQSTTLPLAEPGVSKSALVAFRVIESLSRRMGQGFVRTFQTLARMFGICERRGWQLVKELIAAGLICWEVIRRVGERGIAFWPLVRVPKPSRGRFAPGDRTAFSGRKSAGSTAPSSREKCTLAPSALSKTTPEGRETTNRVVASPAEVSEPESEAVAVAVDAGLTADAARRAVGEKPLETVRSAVRAARTYAARHEVRSLPALLFTAIRAGWLPPAPPPTHPSDRRERPQRVVMAPTRKAIPPDWLPGVEYEAARGFCNEAAQKLRALGDPNPPSAEIRDMPRFLWQRRNPQEVPPWKV